MARFVKSGSGVSPVEWFNGIVSSIDKGAEEGLETVAREGESQIKEFIRTRPARTSGPQGRVRTGKMLGAVSGKAEPRKSNFGWLGDVKPYFLYQEGGFTHAGSGEWIKGMYAVSDAADITFEQFKDHMDKVVRDA